MKKSRNLAGARNYASGAIAGHVSLVTKMLGGGLQVDKALSTKKMSNGYVPQNGGQFPFYPPPFYGNWNNTIGMGKKTGKGKKKENSGKRIAVWKKQSIQPNSNSGRHFLNKPLSNFDLEGWIDKLGMKHFRGIFSRDALPESIHKK